MKFDSKTLQREIDLAAEEFERLGYNDFAERLDQYNVQISAAKKEDLHKLHRSLSRIQAEYEQRTKQQEAESDKSESAKRAENAVTQARRASISRKLAIKRYLRKKLAQRKQSEKKVEPLKNAGQQSSAHKRLAEKIAEAEKQSAISKNRVERLRRIQGALK